MYKFVDLLLLLLFYKKTNFSIVEIINVHNPECFTLYTGWYATNV